jgi:hypothetical protein
MLWEGSRACNVKNLYIHRLVFGYAAIASAWKVGMRTMRKEFSLEWYPWFSIAPCR